MGVYAALEEVIAGRLRRTFAIAGGLHHAHRSRAAGFSVYNDPAVAIAAVRAANPELRVLYLDVDAHHGDGVQEAFAGTAEVLTISIHESGLWLFPGTGFPGEIGYDAGEGYAVNVPLPPLAGDACFELAFDRVVEPLARAFAPDVIVAQLGVDAHYWDPQADLVLSLPGYRAVVRRIIAPRRRAVRGQLAALGGGGYNLATVPVAWTWVIAELCGESLPEQVPESWRLHTASFGVPEAPATLGADDEFDPDPAAHAEALAATQATVAEVREILFPRHGLEP